MNNRRLPLYLAVALAAGGVMTAATLRIGEYRTLPRATHGSRRSRHHTER